MRETKEGRDEMKEVTGYVLIAQAILTGVIVYSIFHLSDSIKESAAYLGSGEGNLGWGENLPIIIWIPLIVVALIGLFLIIKKK